MINKAKWICIPDGKICDTISFRRNIFISKNIEKAILKITAIGVYCAFIDGKKVGDEAMTPGWTSYHDHVFYRENDVTDIYNGETLDLTYIPEKSGQAQTAGCLKTSAVSE